MTRHTRILFDTWHTSPADCSAWLASIGILSGSTDEVTLQYGSSGKYCSVYLRFEHNDPRLTALRAKVSEVLLGEVREREEIDYTKSDLLGTPACELAVGRNLKIQTGEIYGTKYDWTNACPECGIGRKQVGPLIAKRSQFPKGRPIVNSEQEDVLFKNELVDQLVSKAPSVRACFGRVVERRTGESLDYSQAVPVQVFPPHDPSTIGEITDDTANSRRCRACRRNGYFNELARPYQPAYRMSNTEVQAIAPMALTWEHVGFSIIDHPDYKYDLVAPQKIIVRRDMVEVILENKVRGIYLTPIMFIGR